MSEQMTDERLAKIHKRAESAILNDGLPKVHEHGVDILDLLAEHGRMAAEKDWYERKAREAGTIAWQLDRGRARVIDTKTARNIVNQIADHYMRRIPSDDWVAVRQATNDELDGWVQGLLMNQFKGKASDE